MMIKCSPQEHFVERQGYDLTVDRQLFDEI